MDLPRILLLSGLCCAHANFEVSHSFSKRASQVIWTPPQAAKAAKRPRPSSASFLDIQEEDELRILHITDSHVSRFDEDPPHTHRMFSAMNNVEDAETRVKKHPSDQLVNLFRKARTEHVDLIALGGDIINFPSAKEVTWVLEQLKEAAGGIPFLYTAGNHDWHMEFVKEPQYDTSRLPQLQNTLRPLFDSSAATSPNGLYGRHTVKGVDVIFFDNSNHQINEEQLAFAREHLTNSPSQAGPVVLMLHIPLNLPGLELPPKETCGDPRWGTASDELAATEGRTKWPSQNDPATYSFMELVRNNSAPTGRIIALLTGHVHRDFSIPVHSQQSFLENATALSCSANDESCLLGSAFERHMQYMSPHLNGEPRYAKGAVQYSTLDAAEGGYRMLQIRRANP